VSRYRPSPRSMSVALEGLRDDLAPATLLADVQRAWPDAVGPAIAAEAAPISERRGVVTVSCSGGVWAQELDLMSPTILRRLNELLGERRIERLRCVAS
jgi:predicted nucleic acid-binding Zn ribbon protein